MKYVHLLVFSLNIILTFSKSSYCNQKDNCTCYPTNKDVEYQCPKNAIKNYIVINRTEKKLLIDCFNLIEFHTNLLPNVTAEDIQTYQIRSCPLPQNGFQSVFAHFSSNNVTDFQYGSNDDEEKILRKKNFNNLDQLNGLEISAREVEDLEDDFFQATPNLTFLVLHHTKIRAFKTMWFGALPKLLRLDLSENHIENMTGFPTNLSILELWGNHLVQINHQTFEGLTNLTQLELSSNRIRKIESGAFQTLTNLKSINLSMNNLTTLNGKVFSQNPKLRRILINNNPHFSIIEPIFMELPVLEQVDLTNCDIKLLPKNLFKNSRNIKKIFLTNNKIEEVPVNLFEDLYQLQELHLAYNQIKAIDSVFAKTRSLKVLELQNNEIREIKFDALQALSSLETLLLQNNKIPSLDLSVFQELHDLRVIDLSNNQLRLEAGNIWWKDVTLLGNMQYVSLANFSKNYIQNIHLVFNTVNNLNLKSLDLSHNEISEISLYNLLPIQAPLKIDLTYNNITTIKFEDPQIIASNNYSPTIINLNNNPLNCDCFNYDLVRYFKGDLNPKIQTLPLDLELKNVTCANPPNLQHLQLQKLPLNLLICPFEQLNHTEDCPLDCVCSYRPSDASNIFDCANRNLTEYPRIEEEIQEIPFSQTELHLEGNNLKEGPNENLTGYGNVTKLFLSGNGIEELEWLPQGLSVLHLHNNKLSKIDYSVLQILESPKLKNLTLHNNPWSCECGAENLTNFLRAHIGKIESSTKIQCFNSTKLLTDLSKSDLCHVFHGVYIIVIILLLALIISVLFVTYYRFQEPLKVWLFAHQMLLWWVTEEELDKDKTYDAFISYSHKDEDFLVENLLPVLESGPKPYKLCLHFRDFIPGEFIATQVTNSVLQSRRTLVILSPNFLESVWGKMEFRTAHTQAMTEGLARVIIVLLGDIDMENLDEELKAYLKTNTYVKWGDPYFWNKLRYALPHSRCKKGNQQKIANVMNCIDDKFSLVIPMTPNGGTTPIMSDEELAKKTPLNYVPRTDFNTAPAEAGTLLVSHAL